MTKNELIQREATKELARRLFYDYCQLRFPKLYPEDRGYLATLCNTLQSFIEQNQKRFLVINLPPRHMKSLTATNLVEWLLGQDPTLKVMTGSYNETLSTTFARKVRDTIDEQPSEGIEVYNNLFPKTKVKYGQASKSLWALEGSSQDNYLATSPTGTATGFGANYILIDDIIKNSAEAYNQLKLDGDWDWFTNTMLSRTEGNDWKVIVIMTRWAKGDLAGRIIDAYDDLVEVVQFKAVQEDGSMLCDEILNRHDYDIKTREMAKEIVEANYNQQPIDVQGRLYDGFMEWKELPSLEVKKVNDKGEEIIETKQRIVYNYTDTADQGDDWLCSVSYTVEGDEVYILGVVMSDADMEVTEPLVAHMMQETDTIEADIESNNGGRGFARNVQRELNKLGINKVAINDIKQTSNKEARILASSAWIRKHVYMPPNWMSKYPDFATQLLSYQRKGKNVHDDAPDVLAGIYERVANTPEVDYSAPVL